MNKILSYLEIQRNSSRTEREPRQRVHGMSEEWKNEKQPEFCPKWAIPLSIGTINSKSAGNLLKCTSELKLRLMNHLKSRQKFVCKSCNSIWLIPNARNSIKFM